MANNHSNLTSLFTDIADAIRSKTGGSDPIIADQFPEAIDGIESGGGSDDGFPIGDGNTHIWVDVEEGMNSYALILYMLKNTVVTIDWGDGTQTEDITFSDNSYTGGNVSAKHSYTEAGEYVITLSSTGLFGLSGSKSYGSTFFYPTGNSRMCRSAVKKIETGAQLSYEDGYGISMCMICTLTDVVLNSSETSIGGYMLYNCTSLTRAVVQNGISTIGDYVFSGCSALKSVVLPDSVTSIGICAFSNCKALEEISLPYGVTMLGTLAFHECWSLKHIAIPSGVLSIGDSTFKNCYSLHVVDFSNHTAIPTLETTSAFGNNPTIMQIRVPAALAGEWKAATNWSTYADYIVGV